MCARVCGGKNIFIYTTRDFPHPMNTRSSFSPHESFHEYSHDSSHEYSFHEYSHDSFSPMNTHDSFHEYSWFIPSSHESSENNLPKIVTSQRQPTHLLANQRGGDLNDSEIGVRVFEIFFSEKNLTSKWLIENINTTLPMGIFFWGNKMKKSYTTKI